MKLNVKHLNSCETQLIKLIFALVQNSLAPYYNVTAVTNNSLLNTRVVFLWKHLIKNMLIFILLIFSQYIKEYIKKWSVFTIGHNIGASLVLVAALVKIFNKHPRSRQECCFVYDERKEIWQLRLDSKPRNLINRIILEI